MILARRCFSQSDKQGKYLKGQLCDVKPPDPSFKGFISLQDKDTNKPNERLFWEQTVQPPPKTGGQSGGGFNLLDFKHSVCSLFGTHLRMMSVETVEMVLRQVLKDIT